AITGARPMDAVSAGDGADDEVSGWGTAAASAAASTARPHSSQNFAFGRRAVPQAAQARGSAVPQLSQNFAPWRFSVRHAGQFTASWYHPRRAVAVAYQVVRPRGARPRSGGRRNRFLSRMASVRPAPEGHVGAPARARTQDRPSDHRPGRARTGGRRRDPP